MATLTTAFEALQQLLTTDLTGVQSGLNTLTCQVGIDWPGEDVIRQIANSQTQVLVAINDKGPSSNANKFLIGRHSTVQNSCGTTVTLSAKQIGPGQTVTLTLGLAAGFNNPASGDIVALNVLSGSTTYNQTATAAAGNTLSQLASALATAINGNSGLVALVSATVSGAVITLHNAGGGVYSLTCAAANSATVNYWVDTAHRHVQVTVFTGTVLARYAIGDVLERVFGTLQSQYGYPLASGELIGLKRVGDYAINTDVQKGIFRRDFLLELEYGVDNPVTAYPVVAPNPVISTAGLP